MSDDNRAIMQAYYEAWNRDDASELDPFLAEDFVAHDPALGPDFDREGLIQRVDMLRGMFQDLRTTPELSLAQDDLVAYRWRADGTFVGGSSSGDSGGRPVSFTGNTIYRLRDGRIVELWNEWDNVAFFTAIGQAPGTA
jgi:steroid delta-isomerase-like uncharacterized protein